MDDMPERVHLWPGLNGFLVSCMGRGTEYVRADIYDAEIARLHSLLGRDGTKFVRISRTDDGLNWQIDHADLLAAKDAEIARLTRERDAAEAAALERAELEAFPEGWTTPQPHIGVSEREEGSRDCGDRIAAAIRAIPRDGSALTAMLAEAEARGRAQGEAAALERAAASFRGDTNLGVFICCNGMDCGCQGSTAEDYVLYYLADLPRDTSALTAMLAQAEARGRAQGDAAALERADKIAARETLAWRSYPPPSFGPLRVEEVADVCDDIASAIRTLPRDGSALDAVVAQRTAGLREALRDIADPNRLTSHGDPTVLRDRARAALAKLDRAK